MNHAVTPARRRRALALLAAASLAPGCGAPDAPRRHASVGARPAAPWHAPLPAAATAGLPAALRPYVLTTDEVRFAGREGAAGDDVPLREPPDEPSSVSPRGRDGAAGTPGRAGGPGGPGPTLYVYVGRAWTLDRSRRFALVVIRNHDATTVVLRPDGAPPLRVISRGGAGGRGSRGTDGGDGEPGEDRRSPGLLRRGGDGGAGGAGGDGGAGGAGGPVTVWLQSDALRGVVAAASEGGQGGAHGRAGRGGRAGPRGRLTRDDGSTVTGRPSADERDAPAPGQGDGAHGAPGAIGRAGAGGEVTEGAVFMPVEEALRGVPQALQDALIVE